MSDNFSKAIEAPYEPSGRLAEVWGDVVDLRQLIMAIIIGAVISLSAYLIAGRLFQSVVSTPALAHAYAMLVGLIGCIASGAICAILFKPKRIVTELYDEIDERQNVIGALVTEYGTIGTSADLPDATVHEMKDIDLYELFARQEREEAANKAKKREV